MGGGTFLKVKMVDVARKLGISKATVSLAVNGKPGVSEGTRQKIFNCINEMENPEEQSGQVQKARHQIIKIVIINHNKKVVCDPELDLWSGVLSTFDTEARKLNYLYGITYLNDAEENRDEILLECNADIVAGVILFGTEMTEKDHAVCERILKPIVIYDYNMPGGGYNCVCIDNAMAVKLAVDCLVKAGAGKMQYLSPDKQIYNFMERRKSFQNSMMDHGFMIQKRDMVQLGNSTEEITGRAIEHFQNHGLPDAFIMENYQVSIGVLHAVRKMKIAVPEDLKLVGIDEIPDYAADEIKLTQIRIPHIERAALAMSLLDREINSRWKVKNKVFTVPELIPGQSV